VAGNPSEEPTPALVNHGFHFRYDRAARLPCCYVLPLRQPFEETVWKGWAKTHRQEINKAARSGVVVVEDREFKHAEEFVVMLSENVRRHGVRPPTRQEMMLQMEVFRGKSKLFVALLDGKPIVTLLCHYTPSTCYLVRVGSHEKDTNSANRLCYKTAIEDACNAGFGFADLGYTPTQSLAFFKERFRGTRVPVRVYEKRYSILATMMEKGPVRISRAWRNRGYIWSNRGKLWRRMAHI
jgi:lipid II:glycine glycyltransferase (peptidoglycan interpeptide bridge formation enzyme)